MKVTEHLASSKSPPISFEIIPPLRGRRVSTLLELIEDLVPFDPPFIDITSHPAQMVYEETQAGIRRKVTRKRPGTLGICALIQNKYGIDAVPHVLCRGFTREETEDFLIELSYLEIDNVLAVQGDDSGYEKALEHGRSANVYARDLVAQIASLNQGDYLEKMVETQPTSFCVGVGGYPEKHFEAPNLETDVRHTKEKVDAGAEYVVTQMFFDNRVYFDYVDACRAAGIEVPIIPGIKIVTSKKHLSSIPRNFYVDLPTELSDEVSAASSRSQVLEIGVEWAAKQAEELLNRGAPSLHFYIMQSSAAINLLMEKLRP